MVKLEIEFCDWNFEMSAGSRGSSSQLMDPVENLERLERRAGRAQPSSHKGSRPTKRDEILLDSG